METATQALERWFLDRPTWLQEAARILLEKGSLQDNDLKELLHFCKIQAKCPSTHVPATQPRTIAAPSLNLSRFQKKLRLVSISNPKGINALAPRKPFNFQLPGLSLVFGPNGSGKSGYVRLLKHVCGARNPGPLLSNVFVSGSSLQECEITYELDGSNTTKLWTRQSGPLSEIASIQVYDTANGFVYIDEENEVAYEPPILVLFSNLTTACITLASRLDQEIGQKPSRKPIIPFELNSTKASIWYSSLQYSTTPADVSRNCAWTNELELQLITLTTRLAETSAARKASDITHRIARIVRLVSDLANWKGELSSEKCLDYLEGRTDAVSKRRAASEDASKIFENAPLDGVGSESWKLLWKHAEAYSARVAYPSAEFPNLAADARCLLCQQPLDLPAKERLASFERFVKGSLEKEATQSETRCSELLKRFDAILQPEIVSRMDAVVSSDEKERSALLDFWQMLESRRLAIPTAQTVSELPNLPNEEILEPVLELISSLNKEAELAEADAKGDNRSQLEAERLELVGRKWVSQQRAGVEAEIQRLGSIHLLEAAKKLTSTQALSLKKSTLSEELVTDAYINRFQAQLDALGASTIHVKLQKTRAEKGRVFHRISLDKSTSGSKTSEILSEGEFRIISLAAFLADSEGHGDRGPLVFDDPISSLDQKFEERVAKVLMQFSVARQIIVFTHRLSLVALLEIVAKKENLPIDVISLTSESWGKGEPGDIPTRCKKTEAALNHLLARVQRARKLRDESGTSAYDVEAKAICTDFRITLERIVEKDLLHEIVQRFRFDVQTKNKIHELAKITTEDCRQIDDLMTKYSFFEHSQPEETPKELPPPDELHNDLENTKKWLNEFSKREV